MDTFGDADAALRATLSDVLCASAALGEPVTADVRLATPTKVTIKSTDDTFKPLTVDLGADCTVATLHARIAALVAPHVGERCSFHVASDTGSIIRASETASTTPVSHHFGCNGELCLSVRIFETSSFEIFAKTITNRHIVLKVTAGDTIDTIKASIYEKDGTPPDKQCLMFAGKKLENTRTLADYGIQQDNTLHVLLRLRGGSVHTERGRIGNRNGPVLNRASKIDVEVVMLDGAAYNLCVDKMSRVAVLQSLLRDTLRVDRDPSVVAFKAQLAEKQRVAEAAELATSKRARVA